MLRLLRDDDQAERAAFPDSPSQEFLRYQYDRDAARRREVRSLLARDPELEPPALLDAAIILHHGDRPSDFADAHVLAVLAALGDVAAARWWSAAAFDRLLVNLSEPQVAGTQQTRATGCCWRLPARLRTSWLGEDG